MSPMNLSQYWLHQQAVSRVLQRAHGAQPFPDEVNISYSAFTEVFTGLQTHDHTSDSG